MLSTSPEEQLLNVYMGINSDNGKIQVHCCSCSSRFTKLGNFQNHLEREHRICAGPNQYGFVMLKHLQGPDPNSGRNPICPSQYSLNNNTSPTPEVYGYSNPITPPQGNRAAATVQSPGQNAATYMMRRHVVLHARRPPGAANQDANSILAPDDNVASEGTIENHDGYMPLFYQNQYQGYSGI